MAYNRWLSTEYLAHHGVKGQKWGERNGPPYPLDSSISTGSKLIKGDGSPQGKKKYKTSEKTAHKRAERKARTDSKNDERDYKRLQNFFNRHVGWDEIDAIDHDGRINIELEDLARSVVDGKISKKEYNKRASVIRDEIRKRIDEEARNGSEWAPDTQKRLRNLDQYHRAADEGSYELDFLETVQNEKWYNDKKRMLKEYAEYLNDRDAYSQKGLTPQEKAFSTARTSEPVKKQGSKIEAFKDRLFGSKKNEPQKTYTSPEPVKSEKARTKRGEEYEINDWNGNGADTIREFKRNPESHIRIARKAAISEARRLFETYAKDIPEANNALKLSDAEFSKRIKLDFADPFDRGTMVFTFGDAHGDFTGHTIDVEYDLVRRRVVNTSVNG